MSMFDPATFLDATLTDPSTRRPPLAVKDYFGTIGEPKSRAWTGKEDPSKSGIAIDVPITVEVPPEDQVKVGQPTVTLTDSIMLDLTSDGKGIDNSPGKNSKLRRYREATGLNNPGDSFSFRMLQGRRVKVKVSHRVYEGDIMDQVAGVAKA